MRSFTNELIVQALKELLLVKPLSKITVNDIVTRCGIAKQTFYNHFQDKYALFSYAVTTELQNNLAIAQAASRTFEETITAYYRRVQDDSRFYCSFIRDNIAVNEILACVSSNCYEYFHSRIRLIDGETELPDELELQILFFCVGCARLLLDWIRAGFKQSPETMAKINCSCLPEALRKYP